MTQAVLPGMLPDVEYAGEEDFYETPLDAVAAIIPVLGERMARSERWHLLDPGCGRGAILSGIMGSPLIRHLYAPPAKRRNDEERAPVSAVVGVEINRDRMHEAMDLLVTERFNWSFTHGDFLEFTWPELGMPVDDLPLLVAGNPPYSKATEFVEHAVELAAPSGGIVAQLLQLDFATRAKRIHDRWRSGLYPLRRRPSFGGKHSSGERPFSWMIFDLGCPYSDWRCI